MHFSGNSILRIIFTFFQFFDICFRIFNGIEPVHYIRIFVKDYNSLLYRVSTHAFSSFIRTSIVLLLRSANLSPPDVLRAGRMEEPFTPAFGLHILDAFQIPV